MSDVDASVLSVSRGVLESCERAAEAAAPAEACGLLLGHRTSDGATVDALVVARNLEAERASDRFTVHPEDLLSAHAEAEATGRDVLGVWHSHPDAPAVPSSHDLDGAWERWSYLILSLRSGEAQRVRSWRVVEGAFEEEIVALKGEGRL